MYGPVVIDGTIIVRNPADGTELGRVATTAPEQVREAVERARGAASAWAALSFTQRGVYLAKCRDRLLTKAHEIAALLQQENGKPQVEAYLSEVVPNLDLFDFHVANDEKLLRPEKVKLNPMNYPGKGGVIEHLPLGVIGLISPWNYPVSIPLRTIVPALMAGNTVVFKPSEFSALTGKAVAELFQGIVPAGVFEIVQGAGEVGAALITHACDRIVFTGSVATGKKVGVAAAEKLIPASLELGGKDPAIVLEDADLDRTANGLVWGAFANAGQNCASIERVYVHEKIAEPLIQKIVEKTKRLRLTADGTDAEVGPLINEKQVAIVEGQVKDAVAQGAKVLTGGKRRGLFFEPTVLTNVDHRMTVMREETFGPLLPIQIVKSTDDAVRLANDCLYGLTASIWTRDIARGKAVAARLQTGVATINNHSFTAAIPQAPWTGVKATGSGVTNSRSALYELTRPRFTLVDKSKGSLEIWWYPYTQTLHGLVSGVLGQYRRGVGAKLSAIPKLLPLLGKRMKEG
jgi:acyl-CoA reductase-like NAD-dependent aldehyde dehydrogenase